MKRTPKYVAALDCAREFRVTRATTHEGLYGALARAGWAWDPKLAGWYSIPRGPGRPPKLSARTAEKPASSRAEGLFAGMPVAGEAFVQAKLEARIDALERTVATLEKSLRFLHAVPAVQHHMASLFGLDLHGAGAALAQAEGADDA